MTREGAKSVNQRSFWALGTAEAPENCLGRRFASPETGRMLAFARSKESSGECRLKQGERLAPAANERICLPAVRALYDRVHNRSMRECT
jgi:hypothetical protein